MSRNSLSVAVLCSLGAVVGCNSAAFDGVSLTTNSLTEEDPSVWCGAVAESGPYYYAYGTFTVPPLPERTGDLPFYDERLAIWVGIGGGGQGTSPEENKLIQAGISINPGREVRALWQVFGEPGEGSHQVPPEDFLVQPGDEIAASVRFENATEQGGGDATMYVYNFSNGQQLEQPFHLESGFTGATAEWVVEPAGQSGWRTPAPYFGTVSIEGAFAINADGETRFYTDDQHTLAASMDAYGTSCTSESTGSDSVAMHRTM